MKSVCLLGLLAALAGACSSKASANVAKPGAAGSEPATASGAQAASGGDVMPSCGPGKGECPMQRWMKANLQAFQRSHDYSRLAAAFEQLAEVEPKGYEGWAESARQGAEAAAKNDEVGVSKSCETCHKAHRETYRRTLRAQPLL